MLELDIINIVMQAIKEFGFPIVVALWALWRLDKNWAKGENIQSRLDQIEEGLDRIEMAMSKSADINQEMLITLKILNTVIVTNHKNNGGDSK
jgi:hypothetical protein